MSRPVARYRPSRRYLLFALVALLGAVLAAWAGTQWSADGWRYVSYLVSVAFVLTGGFITVLVIRPIVEIHETHLMVGHREIAWNLIRSVDQTSWVSPLTLRIGLERIGLENDESFLLVYPGDAESSAGLLRYVRRYARFALLDGVPYRQFWGETSAHTRREIAPLRYRLLSTEDEREVEQMFQRLKTVGRIDQHSPDERNGEK